MDDMPDLSHLTQEERAIIEGVMMRQKQEEERENEIMRRKQDEVATLVDSIRQKSEQQKKAGVELEATCHICLKTKFADGIGHICHYCNIRCCAKCGGKVTLRNNKVIWVCIVCRKKQELLSKTGQWMNKSTSPDGVIRRQEGDPRTLPQTMLDPHDPSDKRPKLERARSAAEKENNPMQRANSQLRRQYSQQDPPTRRLSQSDGSGMDMMMSPGHHQQQIGRMQQMGHGQVGGMYGGRPGAGQQGYGGGPYGQHSQLPQPPMHHGGGGGGSGPYGGQHSMTPQVHITHAGGGGYGHDDPSYYQSEIEDLMRTHPHLVHPRQQQHYAESLQSSSAHGSSGMGGGGGGVGSGGMHLPPEPTKSHKRPLGGPYLPQQRSFSSSDEDIRSTPEFEENYDRRDKPSVLVTSPGSPDLHSVRNYSSSRYSNRLAPAGTVTQENSVGGRVQIKLGFEPSSLQLIVTILCANGLVPRGNGAARNPYVKICLLPDRSEKSKRRTKTLALTNDPRWGQTFVYEGLRRADLNNRLFEVTVWDYVRYGANDFLGEVIIDLSTHPLDDEAEWYILQPHQETLRDTLRRDDKEPGNELDMILTPTDHLSPPSTTSRLSDSDTTSECDIDGLMTGRDGASVSSLGSSSSPPPEVDLQDRRSRRDMSPQGRKRAAGMVAKDYRTVSGVGQGFHNQMSAEASSAYRRNGTMALNQRSQSAAPSDNYRDDRRDSLSPQDDRYTEYPVLPLHQYAPRFQSRSATATPTGSPKKRQLPQVPHMSRNAAIRERFIQDFEERSGGRFARHRGRQSHHQPTYRSTGMGGWERHYSGLSDSDLTTHSLESRIRPRHSLSPDKDFMGDFGDSDMESVVSVTSSAFSTQSERPRGSKGISDYDVRGRSRYGGHNGGREAYRQRDRDRDRDRNSSDHERDRDLSDREQRESRERGELDQSLSNTEGTPEDKIDGSLSDTAVIQSLDARRKLDQRSPKSETPTRDRDRFGTGMGIKSNSTSQLSATDQGVSPSSSSSTSQRKRASAGSIQRSVEVTPIPAQSAAYRAGSLHSISSSEGSSWSPSLRVAGDTGPLSDFIDGLGPGQLVGRQVLGAPALGDIQLSMCYQKGSLEVEVIRARGLQARPGSKVLPAPYVKVYLVSGKKCIEKAKTTTARKTLDPLYQQQLVFREPFAGCILQVTVWGDYGRMEGKKSIHGCSADHAGQPQPLTHRHRLVQTVRNNVTGQWAT